MGSRQIGRREMLAGLAGLGFGLRATGQDIVFETGVSVVSVLVTVRDKQGRYVDDLTQTDFEIREDGRRQELRYFSRQTDAALTIGMLVDTSMSQRAVLETEQNAGKSFFWQVLRPSQDAAFVIRFDYDVELAQELTTVHRDLDRALDLLDLPQGNGNSRRRAGLGSVGTALYDAVFLAAEDILSDQPGRKTIILLSDGVDYGSRVSLNRAMEAAQKADAVVYAIRIFDESQPGNQRRGGLTGILLGGARRGVSNGEDTLRRMAEETGGHYFEVSPTRGLGDVFRDIEEELRNQYSLGYVSDNPARDGEFRKIEVAARRRGLTVQTREGYYASTAP